MRTYGDFGGARTEQYNWYSNLESKGLKPSYTQSRCTLFRLDSCTETFLPPSLEACTAHTPPSGHHRCSRRLRSRLPRWRWCPESQSLASGRGSGTGPRRPLLVARTPGEPGRHTTSHTVVPVRAGRRARVGDGAGCHTRTVPCSQAEASDCGHLVASNRKLKSSFSPVHPLPSQLSGPASPGPAAAPGPGVTHHQHPGV